MFLPKNFTTAVNGSIHWTRDQRPAFGKPARVLPETTPGGVLRFSSTSKGGTYVGGKRVGTVGLAIIEAQRAQQARRVAAMKRIAGAK